MLVYSTLPSARAILYTAPRLGGCGALGLTVSGAGAKAAGVASITVFDCVGGTVAPCGDGAAEFCFSGFNARGKRSTAILSINSIGQGFSTSTRPGSGGGGNSRTTGAGACSSGLMVITAGLAFTSFGGDEGVVLSGGA